MPKTVVFLNSDSWGMSFSADCGYFRYERQWSRVVTLPSGTYRVTLTVNC